MKKITLLILLSFISLAGFAQQLNEGFEGAPAAPDASGVWTLPSSTGLGLGSWLVRDNRTNGNPNWKKNAPNPPFDANTGTDAAFIDRENTGAGVLAEEWLITPQINVLTNSQLRFFTKQTLPGDTGVHYQVRVSTSATQSNLAAFTTILADYTETELSTLTASQTDYEEKIINLSFAGARYFAFVKVYTQPTATLSGDRWLIDDVKVLQKCDDPIAPLGATNLSATGATLTWSMPAGNTQSNFEVQYGPQGFDLGTGTVVPATSSSTPRQAVLTGVLTADTCYQFYVRAICTISNSEWVGPFNFCTPPLGSTCAAPLVVTGLPYSHTSNTSLYGNNVSAASPGATGCGTTGAFLGGSDVVYSYTPTAAGFLNIQMNPGSATNTGMFVYNSCANIGTSCIAGVGNATASIRNIPALQITAAQVGNPIYIVLSSTTATATYPYTLTIQAVTCPNPVNLGASGQGINSATLTWANGTGNTTTNFQYVVQPAGGTIPTGAGIDVTGTTVTPNNLDPATAYQYWVRADCGNGTFSIWSGPFLFNTTICNAVDQCTYSFVTQDSFGDGWNGATMQVRQNGIVVATITGPTDPDNNNFITFNVPMCNNIPFDLFWNTPGTFPGEVRISIKNSFNQTIYAMTTSSPGLANTVLYSGTVDCVNPLCLPPTGVAVTNINTSNATINWTSSGVPTTGWGVFVVPAGSAPPTGTPTYTVPGPTPTFTIPVGDLAADTAYDVYVQSICSVNSPSTLTPTAVTFTTTPTCPKPTNVTVTNISDTSVTVNWQNVGAGTSWQVLLLPSPSSLPLPTTGWLDATSQTLNITSGIAPGTTYDVYVRAICPGPDVGQPTTAVTFTSAICPIANQCPYTFTVQDNFGDGWNGATMTVTQNGVVVATLTGPTDAQNQTPIPVTVMLCDGVPFNLNWVTAGTFPGEVRVSITNGFSQTLYAMTTASANLAGTTLYSDSRADCQFPKCLPPTIVGATPNIFSAALDWTPANNNTLYDVYLVPNPATAPLPGTTPTYTNISQDQLDALSLQPSTAYSWWVRGICAVGAPGDWVGPNIFTTLPTCPQPIGLNYTTTDSNSANLVWTEVGPATSWHIVVQPSGGAAPSPGQGVLVTTLPTAASPYNTLADFGALDPGFYEFYVMSDCTSTDVSTWSGPMNFFIATALPVCASVEVNVPNDVIDFCPGENCVDLAATFTDSGETTTYNVLPVAFAPPFPFTGGTQVSVNTDDIWSNSITLPFNFCFYGTNYPSIQVGSNGVLTFTPQTAPGNCAWNTVPGQVIPNPAFPIRNAIYGVYQDIDPSEDTAPLPHNINYQILGQAPCRSFVVNYYQVGQFQCGTDVGLQTSQIVLYETSNIIEVYVQDRTVCTWNDGLGVIGLQNEAGTLAHFPPGRNLGAWEAHNEAWRFTPAGASNVQFSWLKDGQPFSTDTNINVCVTETTTMTAQAIYTGCGGQVTTKTKDVLLRVNEIHVDEVQDIVSCEPIFLQPLTVGTYYNQPGGVDPINIENPIEASQTVYVYAATATTPPCSDEKSFTVTIESLEPATLPNVSECVSYTLPAIPAPFDYYTGPDGTGTMYPGAGGDVISATTDLFIYGVSGACSAQSLFTVTIGDIVAVVQPDLVGCTKVILPDLPANNTYYTATGGPNGTGVPITNLSILTSQTIYIYAQSGTCTDESSFTVTIDNNIVPTFDPIPNPCVGATAPSLPLTSTNGIAGTWLPNAVDTSAAGTFTFTFTPDGAISCAVPTTINVTVDPPVVPVFDPIADICLNATAPVLPATSTNGVTGTWSPATIDTTVAGTFCYVFTPDAAFPCAVPTNLCVTVSSQILATFDPIANLCQGATAPALPLVSTNGVTGIWIPGTIDTTNPGTYVFGFSPDANQTCALGTTLTVIVDPSVTPVFSPITDICQNGVAPVLPTTSLNGVTGIWTPPTIDTTVTGSVTYTFTPDASQPCAQTITVTVNVTAPTVPDFTPLITLCTGDTPPVLAATSPNGVNGTWSPATIDASTAGTFTYTFTPNASPLPSTNLVVNGDFSAGNSGFTSDYANIPDAGSFGVQKAYGIVADPFTWFFGFAHCPDHTSGTGNQMVIDGSTTNGGNDSVWCQTVTVQPNKDYVFSYSIQTVALPIPAQMDVVINGTVVGSATAPVVTCNWATYSYTWNSGSNTSAGICLYDRSVSQNGNDFAIDDISFSESVNSQCAVSQTITVVVNPLITPDFAAIASFCSGTVAPVLNGTSPNGIAGTWSPAVISNVADGCYVFTPNAGQCAAPQTLCVTVTPPVLVPDFAPIASFCSGTTAPVLGATSPNGITGTWSPATISNQADGCYVFTPNAGQCALTQTLCVTVTPTLTPDFAPIPAICNGGPAPTLATTSPNGISGTWNPATVSNTTSGTYVFTPTGACANTQTLTVTVNDVPSFDFTQGCEDDLQYHVHINPVTVNFDMEHVSYVWTHNGVAVSTANGGNTQTIIATETGSYEVTVTTPEGCATTAPVNVGQVACTIQKGISPKGTNGGDGLNDFFDLAGLNVKKLEIFNRYGTKVYSKANYLNEWYGQSDKGEELPDGTYFYVIARNGVENVTGWIYINREQ